MCCAEIVRIKQANPVMITITVAHSVGRSPSVTAALATPTCTQKRVTKAKRQSQRMIINAVIAPIRAEPPDVPKKLRIVKMISMLQDLRDYQFALNKTLADEQNDHHEQNQHPAQIA